MNEATLSITLLWTFVFIYLIAGSMDFGSGFWAMVYSNRKDTIAGDIANRYLSPAWEVTNTLLVMFVVALVSFFPRATFTFGTILLIPANLILILLALRTAFMVFAYSVKEYQKILNQISGIAGILIPALLVVVLPVTHGGYVEGTGAHQQLLLGKVFTSPSVYSFIGLAITITLYLSALLLADYAKITGDKSAYTIYRKHAIWTGPLFFLFSLFVLFALENEANWLYANMVDHWLWLLLSTIAFAISYYSLWMKGSGKQLGRPRMALLLAGIQLFIASYTYGASHLPYLIYPATVEESFTNINMYRSLIMSYIIGTLLFVPAFIWHWRLFIRNEKYIKGS